MYITLESVFLHILNTAEKYPILSNTPLALDPSLEDYLLKTIEKTFSSDDIKDCSFKSENNIWQQCNELSWNILYASQSIAKEIFTIMRRNPEIPTADLVFGIVNKDNSKHLFMLKFDYRNAFTHFVRTDNGKISVDFIQHSALFPPHPSKIAEGFILKIDTPSLKIAERKFMVDGIKDFYLSTQILDCIESKSPRQKTTKILQVAEKIADLYYSDEDKMNIHISKTIHNELQNSQHISVETLGQKFFFKNQVAQEEFFERLSAEDIHKYEEFSLTERFQRKFQKQAIKTSSGVEIKIPTQIYLNSDEIEFINNPDGTISLLIKNIVL